MFFLKMFFFENEMKHPVNVCHVYKAFFIINFRLKCLYNIIAHINDCNHYFTHPSQTKVPYHISIDNVFSLLSC